MSERNTELATTDPAREIKREARRAAVEMFAEMRTFEFWQYVPTFMTSEIHQKGWLQFIEKHMVAIATRVQQQAVEEERERCLAIVTRFTTDRRYGLRDVVAREILAAIKGGTEKPLDRQAEQRTFERFMQVGERAVEAVVKEGEVLARFLARTSP